LARSLRRKATDSTVKIFSNGRGDQAEQTAF
jgi:hypothetical protein